MQKRTPLELMSRYNQAAPRYTSYPPAPHWHAADGHLLKEAVAQSTSDLSIYVHIPFCERLCLYCGCNTVISKDKTVATPYVHQVVAEMDLLAEAHGRLVTQVHWGGGTPTYLSESQITELATAMASRFAIPNDAEMSVEIDPRVTSRSKLAALRAMGFNRLSIGVQDFDPLVQKAVRRIQSYEMTRETFESAREMGFHSINVDLIYGLPLQTTTSFATTLERILTLKPDRIAAFSYAHVPSLKKQQRAFERDLPSEDEKLRLFLMTIDTLTAGGYRYIGIDHFALPDDPLELARQDGSLHRNFQGYTTKAETDLIGFGVSAISHLGNTYTQNTRETMPYAAAVYGGVLPTSRGYVMTADDRIRAAVIESILCNGVVIKSAMEKRFGIRFDEYFNDDLDRLASLEDDGLVEGVRSSKITLTSNGRIFCRVVARTFDAYQTGTVASKAV